MEKIKGKVKEFLNPNDDPRTHHQRAKNVWKAMKEFLEYSAYSTLGNAGEMIFEKFPVTLMTKENREAYYVFKGEITEAEESYLKAQEYSEATNTHLSAKPKLGPLTNPTKIVVARHNDRYYMKLCNFFCQK